MRIKPAGIIVVLAIMGVLAYFALKPKLSGAGSTGKSDTSGATWGTDSLAKSTSASNEKSGKNEDSRDFNYTPEEPQNGILKGVVELGATGFNSFVVNMDNQKRWKIVSKDFGESLAYEGLSTTDDVRTGLKKYIAGMFDKGVAKNNVHFVISSGAQKEPKTQMISNELKKMGYVVNNVTAEQEGVFALKSAVPPSFTDNSFVVDIGSGNTKVSWDEGGKLKSIELPGAKYYQKGLSDDAVYNTVKKAVSEVPESKRNVAFIIGGVPFTLAKQTRKGDERYTVLKAPADYKAADKKMESGLNIYKAVVDATHTDTFVFDWDANFTIGFLLGLKK
ncbi:hypothetical protein [Mucilaginibacter sp. CSA2-8R]|uniref:hypothetical protein n=1 Tax=Mucilaginibacter sp. CSA2-8R TaxID=3141542 RepID=UPI00315CC244